MPCIKEKADCIRSGINTMKSSRETHCQFIENIEINKLSVEDRNEFNLCSQLIHNECEFNTTGLKPNNLKHSPRILSIQKKVDCLRKHNDSLTRQIRQICDSSKAPSKADIEYLNHLFKLDQQHVKELGESLAKGKQQIDACIQETETLDYNTCKYHNHSLKSEPGQNVCKCGFVMGTNSPKATLRGQKKGRFHERCFSPGRAKRCCRDTDEYSKHDDLSTMEAELVKMKQRLEKLSLQPEYNIKSRCVDGDGSLFCQNRNRQFASKNDQEEEKQKHRCIIS